MKTLKVICLATAVALTFAGAAQAEKCKTFKSHASASSMKVALSNAIDAAQGKKGAHVAQNAEFADGKETWTVNCASDDNKYHIDRDYGAFDALEVLLTAMNDPSPGKCRVRIKLCPK